MLTSRIKFKWEFSKASVCKGCYNQRDLLSKLTFLNASAFLLQNIKVPYQKRSTIVCLKIWPHWMWTIIFQLHTASRLQVMRLTELNFICTKCFAK